MMLRKTVLILCCLFCVQVGSGYAANLHTVKGVVITPDGTVVPQFSVVVRPVSDKPQLVERKHFKNGEFTIDGLQPGKYQIQISSPLFVGTKLLLDWKAESPDTDYQIVILHPFRNEARLTPGAAYVVSAKVLEQNIPDAARDAYLKGVELHREGKLDSALIEYGRALRAHPRYLEALTDIGTIFLLYNRPLSALTFLRRAQDVDDCNPIINLNIAIALTEQNDNGGAMRLLKKILEREQRLAVAQYFMAKIYFAQKDYSEADAYLQQALENDPKLLDAWLLMIQLSRVQDKHDMAREALRRIRQAMENPMLSEFIDEQLLVMGN
jgi:tetratricopeptide (TPR) repeat protein